MRKGTEVWDTYLPSPGLVYVPKYLQEASLATSYDDCHLSLSSPGLGEEIASEGDWFSAAELID